MSNVLVSSLSLSSHAQTLICGAVLTHASNETPDDTPTSPETVTVPTYVSSALQTNEIQFLLLLSYVYSKILPDELFIVSVAL